MLRLTSYIDPTVIFRLLHALLPQRYLFAFYTFQEKLVIAIGLWEGESSRSVLVI